MEVSLPDLRYANDRAVVRFSDESLRRIVALPGVQFAAVTTILPLAGTNSDSSFAIEGRNDDRNAPAPDEEKREVSPDYFRAIGTPLVKGRFFTPADNADALPVLIINQALARALDLLPRCDDLTTLSLDLGFSSHSHFTAAFRQTYGRTPREFQGLIR